MENRTKTNTNNHEQKNAQRKQQPNRLDTTNSSTYTTKNWSTPQITTKHPWTTKQMKQPQIGLSSSWKFPGWQAFSVSFASTRLIREWESRDDREVGSMTTTDDATLPRSIWWFLWHLLILFSKRHLLMLCGQGKILGTTSICILENVWLVLHAYAPACSCNEQR
jgi:hypothetical protein